jgi:Mn2+/Fe2+ NRAMP family transporter
MCQRHFHPKYRITTVIILTIVFSFIITEICHRLQIHSNKGLQVVLSKNRPNINETLCHRIKDL